MQQESKRILIIISILFEYKRGYDQSTQNAKGKNPNSKSNLYREYF